MKISVSCGGRFHGFDMAAYFERKGCLHQLITGYPKSEAVKFGINKKRILSIYLNEIINRLTNKLRLGYPLNTFACQVYDYVTALMINKTSDVYFLWSGYSLYTIKAIRRTNTNAKIILVRGSAHILTQRELLQKISSSSKKVIDSSMIKREVAEYELSDYITVPSSFAYSSFIAQSIEKEKLFLNLLGVDLSMFPFKSKPKDRSVLHIGYAGVLSSRKNVEGIINVHNQLLLQNISVHLHIIGQIDETTFDKTLLLDSVEYNTSVKQNQLFNFYHNIDVFVLNSIEDGFGMVLLQAMSCGCAIIATENSGGPDVITNFENGFIIPAFDNKALYDALNWFSSNKEKIPEMGLKNRKISENGYSWDDFGNRNFKFVKDLLKNENS